MALYASSDLFAASLTNSDGPGIAFSKFADFHSTDGVLEVRYFGVGGYFEFRTFCGHNNTDVVQISKAVEKLRLYLIYKYGVYLEVPAAKHAP